MNTSIIRGSIESVLSRNEMKNIMAGNCPSCASCANDCNGLYGNYMEECEEVYDDPSQDEQPLCFQEVRELNRLCINDCFGIN